MYLLYNMGSGYHDLDVCELKFVVKFVVCLAEPDTERERESCNCPDPRSLAPANMKSRQCPVHFYHTVLYSLCCTLLLPTPLLSSHSWHWMQSNYLHSSSILIACLLSLTYQEPAETRN